MNPIEDALNAEMISEIRRKAVDAGKDPDFAELEALAAKLHAEGRDFTVEQGHVLTGVPRDVDQTLNIDIGTDHIRLGVVSDSHGGSVYEQNSALHHFYRYADGILPHPKTGERLDKPVDAFIHGGDWTQGPDKMHREQPYVVHAHGADQQVDYVVASYPRSERGTPTYGISGNHDASYLGDGGINVFRMIADRREDIVYVGQDAQYLTLGRLKLYVIHPDGGGAYAKSYKSQKGATALPISKKVNILLRGHYHSFDWVEEHGIEAIMLPCFQSQYGWLARKDLHPDIGGLILDVWMTRKGEVGRLGVERVRYQARDNDWDHAASAAVVKSWNSKGLVVP
jgi:predicted phosphodiesterase